MLQGYQIRMLEEYKQLNDRVEKLEKFINESPVFSKMECINKYFSVGNCRQ